MKRNVESRYWGLVQTARPQGHGYVEAEVTSDNLFFQNGAIIKGHEFHYSKPQAVEGNLQTAFSMGCGVGFQDKKDGVVQGNVFAAYTHIDALGTPEWAPRVAAVVAGFAK